MRKRKHKRVIRKWIAVLWGMIGLGGVTLLPSSFEATGGSFWSMFLTVTPLYMIVLGVIYKKLKA
jgi:hypothetical protein